MEKCDFGKRQVHYLGHVISHNGVSVDPSKIEAILKWPKPSRPKALKGFLGLCGYYRKFIQHFGTIARPLTAMTKKNSFTWTPPAEAAFIALKQAMTHAPVLAMPDFSKVFIVECDASGTGVGAVLFQERPIAFFSHALQGKNLLLSTYEKEILALVLAVQRWRPYLLGRQFIVRSDHQALRHLWSQRITTTAQQRWLFKLMGFDFVIEYKKGGENKVADALSRQHEDQPQTFAISSPLPHFLEAIREEVQKDATLQNLVQLISKGEVVGPWLFKDGILFFKNRIYLAAGSHLISEIMAQFHDSTHEGFFKTLQRIRANFYWKGMRNDLKQYIRECEVCQQNKADLSRPAGLLQPLPIPSKIWEDISMDFIDGLPNSFGKTTIYVVVDRLSKYAHFIAVSHPYTAVSVAQLFFDNIFKLYGMPKTIVCDRDVTFTSLFWKELFTLNGLKFNFSSAYHPQTDGQSEVVNRTLEMYLRCLTGSQPKKWVKWLSWVEYCYNTGVHSSTGKTPYELVYGKPPPTLLSYVQGTAKVAAVEEELMSRDAVLKEAKESLQQAQSRMKVIYDGKHSEREFLVGDEVYLKLQPYMQLSVATRKNIKLAARYFGPYKILERIGRVAYRLDLPQGSKIHPVFHVSLLKKHVGSKAQIQMQLPAVQKKDQQFFPRPAAVLEARNRKGKEEVLVHWQGLTPAEATWEDSQFLRNQFPDFTLGDKSIL